MRRPSKGKNGAEIYAKSRKLSIFSLFFVPRLVQKSAKPYTLCTNKALIRKFGKNELSKSKPSKSKLGKSEPCKSEPRKSEPRKNELGKSKPSKSKLGKGEPSKNELSKNEPCKSEHGKRNPGKRNPGKSELGKNEPDKSKPRKNENSTRTNSVRTNMAFSLKCAQKRLGARSFFACVLAIDLIVILAIDMYAPALPSMQETFNVSIGYLNLTMFAFFFISAFATFLVGPASDCVGRKPFFVAATVLFTVASAGCAASPSVELLVAFRVLQGISVGATQTLVTALIQDAFAPNSVQTAMTFLQSLVIIGPVFAPFLGTFILSVTNWRGVFGILAGLGAAAVALSLLITETHKVGEGEGEGGAPQPSTSSVAQALAKVTRDCKELASNKSFLSLALIMGFAGVPFFAFIAVVSYILMNDFGLSYAGYSVIYAAASLLDCIAPFVYLALSKRLTNKRILRLCFVLIAISGIALVAVGKLSPLLFFLAFAPYALAEGIVRPLAYVDLLNQPPSRVGSASALANFSYTLITAVATVVATLEWPSLIVGLGIISLVTAAFVLALYLWGQREG